MIDPNRCIGCQACAEACPSRAISFSYDAWGEGKAALDAEKCVGCGLCDAICPAIHADVHPAPENVYAVVSKSHRETGSSGGVFFPLASRFIEEGGAVYGAAFDENLKLVHRRATAIAELPPLCRSKYLHSDMSHIFSAIREDLKSGKKVLFVGTPCQVSAVKNMFSKQYRETLYLVDFLCRGTGTQRVFDACIHQEEIKRGGKITQFSFRAKLRKVAHSFSYVLDKGGKQKTVAGYSFEFPYYFSFTKYIIFNDACYSCPYSQNARVGDITLGDFWGIQRYNPALRDQDGVSMLAVNSEKGKYLFDGVKEGCTIHAYPLSYAARHNPSFCSPTPYPQRKRELAAILSEQGEAALVRALACTDVKKRLLYAKIPVPLRKLYQKLLGKG